MTTEVVAVRKACLSPHEQIGAEEIPMVATSVPSESLFSSAGNVINNQ